VKIRTLSITLSAAALLAASAGAIAAHPGEGEHAPHTITVEPVRSAEAAQKILERERAAMKMPELMVGMKAPKLQIAEWVKGDSVRGFENGQTYVVEFWATWCGPCIRAFPHVTEVQEKYKDDLTVIGVNIWDRKKNRETGEYTETMPDLIQRVDEFVAGQGDKMGYTVAIEESDKMAENWMRAAGRNGIPSAFIVDGAGKIAWAGHPMTIDEPLAKVIKGEWDLEEGRKAQVAELEGRYFYPRTMELLSDDATAEQGYELVYAMLQSPMADEPMMLNAIAWNILTNDKVAARDYDAAIAAASAAAEKTDWKDPSVIDTLARAYFDKGNRDKAIELQGKAVEIAKGTRMEADLTKTLEAYKDASNED